MKTNHAYAGLRKIHLQIWQDAMECPETVLETAGHRVSLRQLRYCAYHAPEIAYGLRHKWSSKRRAVILGYTIKMASLAFDDNEVKLYMGEISDSMITHPSIWKSNFDQDWNILCHHIQMVLGFDFGLSEDLALIHYPRRPAEPWRCCWRCAAPPSLASSARRH